MILDQHYEINSIFWQSFPIFCSFRPSLWGARTITAKENRTDKKQRVEADARTREVLLESNLVSTLYIMLTLYKLKHYNMRDFP